MTEHSAASEFLVPEFSKHANEAEIWPGVAVPLPAFLILVTNLSGGYLDRHGRVEEKGRQGHWIRQFSYNFDPRVLLSDEI